MNVTIRFPSYPSIEPIHFQASELATTCQATANLESALAHLAPGASLDHFQVIRLGHDDIEDTRLSEALSASVADLSNNMFTIAAIMFSASVGADAIDGWLNLFGKLPDSPAGFDAAYQGLFTDGDTFANEDQIKQYGLDVTAPYYRAIDWNDAWQRMGYEHTHGLHSTEHGVHVYRLPG